MKIESLTVYVDMNYMVEDARLTEARNIINRLINFGVISEEDTICLSGIETEKIEGGKVLTYKKYKFTAKDFGERKVAPPEE